MLPSEGCSIPGVSYSGDAKIAKIRQSYGHLRKEQKKEFEETVKNTIFRKFCDENPYRPCIT